MPKSKKRTKVVEQEKKSKQYKDHKKETENKKPRHSPKWYPLLISAFLIVGLAWIIVYYVTQGRYPIQSIDAWNIAIGALIAFIGFMLALRWK